MIFSKIRQINMKFLNYTQKVFIGDIFALEIKEKIVNIQFTIVS